MTPLRQEKIDEELVKMISTDFQPFSIVEDTGFKKYSQALNPSYIPPSRKALAQKVTDTYDRETASLKRRVSKVPAVCLTTDCWTSRTTASYMSVTCHFIEDFRVASWTVLNSVSGTQQTTLHNSCLVLQQSGGWTRK